MRPLTDQLPKPLIPVAGRPLIDYALDQLREGQVERAIVNLHYLGDQIAAHLAGIASPRITLSDERARLRETGGGIRFARGLLGTAPIFTLNSDAVWTRANPIAALREVWQPARMEALLLLIPRHAATGHGGPGDFNLSRTGAVVRRGAAAEADFVFSGAQIIDPRAVYAHPADVFSLNAVWDGMLARGTLYGAVFTGRWCDVGQPGTIALAEELLA